MDPVKQQQQQQQQQQYYGYYGYQPNYNYPGEEPRKDDAAMPLLLRLFFFWLKIHYYTVNKPLD